jgi:O-antigen/teichoic acid export membrane protein
MDKDSVERKVVDDEASQAVSLDSLTSGKVLARNTVWNLLGQGAPMVMALFAIPVLVKGLGVDRFGVLTLAWMVIGYFNFFDLGLGRALIQLVSQKEGTGDQQDIPSLAWTALLMMATLSLLGALVMGVIAPWLVTDALKVPEVMRRETLHSFYLLAVSIPMVIITAGLKGMLQAKQRFDLVNALGAPLSLFSFLAPLAVLPFSSDLSYIVAILVIGKAIGCLAHLWLCAQVLPGFLNGFRLQKRFVKPLFYFGGWITVSNVVGPLTLYVDRFLIGGIISVAAVAYYTTPYEMITRLLIVPGALASVVFPAFSVSFAQDPQRAARIYRLGMKCLFMILFPITLIVVLFAKELLLLWLGVEFAENSFRPLQLLAIGVLILGLESVPFVLLQGAGRPDLPTKLNLIELPFYLAILWWLTQVYGINGTALAWFMRAATDALLLWVFAHRLLPKQSQNYLKIAFGFILVVASLGLAILNFPVAIKIEFLSATLMIHLWFSWVFLLGSDERVFLRGKINFTRS